MRDGPFRWVVGVDWARRLHRVCLLDTDARRCQERGFDNSGRGFQELLGWLLERSGAQPGELAVGLERPDGPLVEALLAGGLAVFSINPKQADRFRDRLSPAGAKDDRRDAQVLASALATDLRAFRRVRPLHPTVGQLREVTRERATVMEDLKRLGLRIREHLLGYWPEMEAILGSGEATASWFERLWSRAPTPERASRMRVTTLAKLLKQCGVRRFEAAALKQRLSEQRAPVPAWCVEAKKSAIRRLLGQVRRLRRDLKALDAEQRRLLDELREHPSSAAGRPPDSPPVVDQLRSCPGVGRVVAATLLSEAPELVFTGDHRRLRLVAGVAPVTRSSGAFRRVHLRRAVNPRLRDALFFASRTAVTQSDSPLREAFERFRGRGDKWPTALRKVADRQLRILAGMTHNGTLYDPNHRRQAA